MPPTQLSLNSATYRAIEAEACKRSLATFVKRAWHVLEPGQPYIHGWHVDAICEHLQAISEGQLNRLLINIPPGTMKSTLVSVFWPAFEWGPLNKPHTRVIGASHEQGLAVRDTLKMRRLVESDWYQSLWPIQLRRDQNEKMYYENGSTGFRQACAVKSMTGRRGDRVIWDDPHSVESAISDSDRATALRVFQETLPTRVVNPDSSAIVIVMQRLHENDVSGFILEGDYGYEHLCLPMEYEAPAAGEKKKTTCIGFSDPRTEEGELLFPARFSAEVVERDKKLMGSYATAGQFQQRPAPRGGNLFAWEKLEIVDGYPAFKKVIRYWDKAGTEDGGAYTAGVLMGAGVDDYYYVLDVVREQMGATRREKVIRQTAEVDTSYVTIWIEQEPGSGGKESAESTILTTLAGFSAHSERPTGDKAVRAEPFAIQVEASRVRLLRGPWNKDYIAELKTFPASKYKDQVDASRGAFNKLTVETPAGIFIPSRIAKAHRNGNL